jgi:hypothetical protein
MSSSVLFGCAMIVAGLAISVQAFNRARLRCAQNVVPESLLSS